jgi:hypothetical protein
MRIVRAPYSLIPDLLSIVKIPGEEIGSKNHMNDSPLFFPPVYPFSYYFSQHFNSRHEKPFSYLPFDSSNTLVYSATPLLRNRLLSDFEKVTFDRSGFMVGEYVALSDGLFLMDRKGNCISINFPNDSSMMARHPFETVNTQEFWHYRQTVLDNWNQFSVVENGSIWSHIYHDNYYHFTYEFLQKARLTEPYRITNIVIPPEILKKQFQRDLLSRALGDRTIIPGGYPIRMINPILADAWQSHEGLWWLRNTMKFSASPGKNRYYVRRAPRVGRGANNISESAEFLEFLRRHNFKAIDFGNGEIPVSNQIDMLRDAAVIISPHGAGMTNISYLHSPLAVIEYFGRRVLSASFMQISISLGFKYYGIIGEHEDKDQCIVPDIKLLDEIMFRCTG